MVMEGQLGLDVVGTVRAPMYLSMVVEAAPGCDALALRSPAATSTSLEEKESESLLVVVESLRRRPSQQWLTNL